MIVPTLTCKGSFTYKKPQKILLKIKYKYMCIHINPELLKEHSLNCSQPTYEQYLSTPNFPYANSSLQMMECSIG